METRKTTRDDYPLPKTVKFPIEQLEAVNRVVKSLKSGFEPNMDDIEAIDGWIDNWLDRQVARQMYTEELKKRNIQE